MSDSGAVQAAWGYSSVGIWTTVDTGATWTYREPRGSQVDWLDVAVSGDGQLMTALPGCQCPIYTSSDSGATWTARGPSKLWGNVAISNDGSKQTATTKSENIWTSSDAGACDRRASKPGLQRGRALIADPIARFCLAGPGPKSRGPQQLGDQVVQARAAASPCRQTGSSRSPHRTLQISGTLRTPVRLGPKLPGPRQRLGHLRPVRQPGRKSACRAMGPTQSQIRSTATSGSRRTQARATAYFSAP